jgi:hypothetical protein
VGGFLQEKAPMVNRAKRGRPLKFGRPARTIAITLPDDVIAALKTIDADVARAVVALVGATRGAAAALPTEKPLVDVARIGRRQSLIIVDPRSFPSVPGCSLCLLSPDSAFIALQPGARLADLEVAVIDELAQPQITAPQRSGLLALRRALRRWRTDKRVTVSERAIVVLEGSPEPVKVA